MDPSPAISSGSNPSTSASNPGRGRPTKLTPERHLKIVSQVRKGVPVEIAAGVAGVSRDVFYDWMKRGKEDEDFGDNTIYLHFLYEVLKARDELEAELAAKWKKISTEGTEKTKRVYKEQLVPKKGGGFETIRYLESETIEINGDGDWRGISEFMLRRYSDRWNRKEGVELSGPNGGPIEISSQPISLDKLSPAAQLKILEILESELGPEMEKVVGASQTDNSRLIEAGDIGDNGISGDDPPRRLWGLRDLLEQFDE